jgi:glycosyltransferase involved in cell wall biosynthesis
MRVLLAHNRYRVPGGEERHVELLERGLTEAGVEVRRFERESSDLEPSRGARIATGLALPYRPGGGGIARAIDEWRPDVVHFHNLWPLLTPAALRIARRRGAAVVLTLHNYRFACPGGTLLRDGAVHDDCVTGSSLGCALRNPRGSLLESLAYGLALEIQRRLRLLSRWVDLFVAPSGFLRDTMVRAGLPAERTAVVRYGVAVDSEGTEPLGERRGLLFSGRLSPEKGVDVLLEAAKRAPEVPIAIAGTGPWFERLRAAAPASVSFLGWLDQSELAATRARSLMSLQPSVCYDVSPFASIEAAASGCGVIASRIGGLPEIVREDVSGVLVEPGDPDALAGAMRAVAADPDRACELGRRARQLAREEFELGRQTARLIEHYEAVA